MPDDPLSANDTAWLTLEDRLIFACSRSRPDVRHIEDLLEQGPDWQVSLRKAESWHVAPLVYASLRLPRLRAVPRPVVECLRHLYHRDTIYGVATRALMCAALQRLSEASVPVILLGGAALATLVYPSPRLRPMDRIDLLVYGRDLERAGELLRGVPAVPYLGPESLSLLDLREHLWTPPNPANCIPIEGFWHRARPARIESVATRVLSREDLLLQVALDLAARLSAGGAFDGGVRALCDISETCTRNGTAVNWGRLVRQAEAYYVANELSYALRLARDLVGAGVPSRALAELRTGVRHLDVERRFVQAILAEDHGPTAESTSDAVVAVTPTTSARRPNRPEARAALHAPGQVAVTYDQGGTDGVGSQLARIYGLYAFSRAVRIPYVHTPLGEVRYQGLMPLLTGRADPEFEARYNAFFSLPSDNLDLEGCERVRAHSLDATRLETHQADAAVRGRLLLLQAHDAYPYLDRHPEAYLALKAVSPYRHRRAEGSVRVCIHLRRGDMLHDGRSRWLPNSYFLRACGAVLEALRNEGVPFIVRLHTEVPPRPYTLYPDMPGLYIALERPTTIDPAQYALEDFDVLPNLEMVLNVEPQKALDDFATADVLIPARSDLGFLGGLLNVYGMVVGVPSYHTPPPGWLVADEHGGLDRGEVATRIHDLLRHRTGPI
jgi:hypothetical protein